MKVLHYKSNFLNSSETFIKRLVENHRQFTPAGMCIEKRDYSSICPVYEQPKTGFYGVINSTCFHLNWCLPFYIKTIKLVKPDIIHAHFGFDGYRMIKPSQKTGVPMVVSFYGSDVSRLPKEFDWNRRYRKLAAYGQSFIAASTLMKEHLINLGFPKQKISVVRFGLDLDKFHFANAYSLQNPVMMVGRMVEKKGFIYALQAIRILKKQEIPIHLDLYGDGVLRSTLEQKARQWSINHLVRFHGQQPVDVILQACRNHSLLLVPSITASDGDQEGIPNTLLEGMACGIPVIATHHSAIPEVIKNEKNGLLIDEKDADALAEMILLVKSDNFDLSTIRQKARIHVEEYYDVKHMAEQVENIYGKVLGD